MTSNCPRALSNRVVETRSPQVSVRALTRPRAILPALMTRLPSVSGTKTSPIVQSLIRCFVVITCLLFQPTAALIAADPPSMNASIDSEEIFIGESIGYQVEIRNSERPVAPDVSPLKEDFQVEFQGDQSRNQSSTMIINGRVSQRSVLSHIYLYKLTPKKSGTLAIPSLTAQLADGPLTSNALTVLVQDAEEQDVVLVETSVGQSTVYPTQSFTVTLRIAVKPLPDNGADPLRPLRRRPPHIELNWLDAPDGLSTDSNSQWLRGMLSDSGVGFSINELTTQSGSIFDGPRSAVFDLYKGRESRKNSEGETNYYVYELKRNFLAERPGTYEFGPVVVKGTFVAGVERGEYSGKRIVAIAPSKSIVVKEVPADRPLDFSGGIGQYGIIANATPNKLRVGDPLTLTLEFSKTSKSGSLELLKAPDLSANEPLTNSFDIIDSNPTGRIEGEVKKFVYGLRPKSQNVSIPEISVSVFDPTTEKFSEIRTKPIPLEVGEASKLNVNEIVGSPSKPAGSDLRSSSSGIFQNITDTREVFNQKVRWTNWAIAVSCTWGACLFAVIAINFKRHRAIDTVGTRRSRAGKNARARINSAKQLVNTGKNSEAMREVRAAFVGLIADCTNNKPEGMTTGEVILTLNATNLGEEKLQRLRSLLESLEAAEYGAGLSSSVSELIDSANVLLEPVIEAMERKRA